MFLFLASWGMVGASFHLFIAIRSSQAPVSLSAHLRKVIILSTCLGFCVFVSCSKCSLAERVIIFCLTRKRDFFILALTTGDCFHLAAIFSCCCKEVPPSDWGRVLYAPGKPRILFAMHVNNFRQDFTGTAGDHPCGSLYRSGRGAK